MSLGVKRGGWRMAVAGSDWARVEVGETRLQPEAFHSRLTVPASLGPPSFAKEALSASRF